MLDGWSDRQYFDAVVIANTDSVLRAVDYLIEKGHKQIGYLAGDLRIRNFKDRERGYRQALEDAALRPIRHGTSPWVPRSRAPIVTWVLGSIRSRTTICRRAFFAENDVLAVGAMRALSEHGIRVPEDVSMIGFDDLSVGAFSNPPLTTVHVPKHEVGEIAVRRLVGNIRNPKSYTCKTAVSTYFVERQSVREL